MRSVHIRACFLLAAALGISGGCSSAEPPRGERVRIEPFPTEAGVKLLEHQASPLPENPPIRFKKVFSLKATWPFGRALAFLAFSPDGNTLAGSRAEGGQNHDVTLWDFKKRKLLHVLPHTDNYRHRIGAMAFLPPGNRLVTGCWNLNKVFLWDVESGKLLATLDTGGEPRNWITGLGAFPDGKRVICCASTGVIVWDVESKTQSFLSMDEDVPLRSLPQQRDVPRHCYSVAFTADGSRFATTVNAPFFTPRILIWDAKTCRVTRAIPAQGLEFRFAYAPDGSSVAADYYDPIAKHSKVIGVWDAASGKKMLAGRLFNSGNYALAYTRDGKYLLVAGQHRDPMQAGAEVLIGVWEVATGKVVSQIGPVPTSLSLVPGSMAISPDNKFLAIPGRDIDIYAIEYTGN